MLDSFGKLPHNMLGGDVLYYGSYSECVDILEENWNGKYCMSKIKTKNSLVTLFKFEIKINF